MNSPASPFPSADLLWRNTLSAAGEYFDPDAAAGTAEILHFGQPTAELQQAADAGATLTPLLHLARLEISGPDARTFVHGQFTNDVQTLAKGEAQLSAWCTAKGRVLANFILWAQDETFELLLSADLLPAFLKRLRMYVLRSKVTLTDLSGSIGHLGLAGSEAATALSALGLPVPQTPLSATAQGEVIIVRLPDARFILSAPFESLPDLWRQLSSRLLPVGQPVWRALDIRAAFPWITGATTEAFVPQMMDWDKLGGVNFKKGCYPGQEIVARTQYLGEIKRHLFRLQSPVLLAAGESLHSPSSPDQAAGKVIASAPAFNPAGQSQYTALAVALIACAGDLHQGNAEGPRLVATPVHP
jgi:folate-binding protein YgfZ